MAAAGDDLMIGVVAIVPPLLFLSPNEREPTMDELIEEKVTEVAASMEAVSLIVTGRASLRTAVELFVELERVVEEADVTDGEDDRDGLGDFDKCVVEVVVATTASSFSILTFSVSNTSSKSAALMTTSIPRCDSKNACSATISASVLLICIATEESAAVVAVDAEDNSEEPETA